MLQHLMDLPQKAPVGNNDYLAGVPSHQLALLLSKEEMDHVVSSSVRPPLEKHCISQSAVLLIFKRRIWPPVYTFLSMQRLVVKLELGIEEQPQSLVGQMNTTGVKIPIKEIPQRLGQIYIFQVVLIFHHQTLTFSPLYISLLTLFSF